VCGEAARILISMKRNGMDGFDRSSAGTFADAIRYVDAALADLKRDHKGQYKLRHDDRNEIQTLRSHYTDFLKAVCLLPELAASHDRDVRAGERVLRAWVVTNGRQHFGWTPEMEPSANKAAHQVPAPE
jgi:hypothetical protein